MQGLGRLPLASSLFTRWLCEHTVVDPHFSRASPLNDETHLDLIDRGSTVKIN